jgi:hypothetical protein
MEYFTNASASGPVRYGQLPGSIGVLEALDRPDADRDRVRRRGEGQEPIPIFGS